MTSEGLHRRWARTPLAWTEIFKKLWCVTMINPCLEKTKLMRKFQHFCFQVQNILQKRLTLILFLNKSAYWYCSSSVQHNLTMNLSYKFWKLFFEVTVHKPMKDGKNRKLTVVAISAQMSNSLLKINKLTNSELLSLNQHRDFSYQFI